LLKDGDKIRVDVPNRKLDVEVSDEELERRRAAWTPPGQPQVMGTLLMYATSALQADEGAGWPVRWSDLDKK
jgi:dihydroxy-acid dehydratase